MGRSVRLTLQSLDGLYQLAGFLSVYYPESTDTQISVYLRFGTLHS